MSAKAAVSAEPRSMVCFSKAISSGRLTERALAARKTTAHNAAVLPSKCRLPNIQALSVFRNGEYRKCRKHGVAVISQLLHQADAGSVIAIRGKALDRVKETRIALSYVFSGRLLLFRRFVERSENFDLLRFRQLQEGRAAELGLARFIQALQPLMKCGLQLWIFVHYEIDILRNA